MSKKNCFFYGLCIFVIPNLNMFVQFSKVDIPSELVSMISMHFSALQLSKDHQKCQS